MSNSCNPLYLSGKPLFSIDVSYLTFPEITIIGKLSTQAPITPVIAFVAPGPLVTQTAAIFPEYLAYASAAIAQACS